MSRSIARVSQRQVVMRICGAAIRQSVVASGYRGNHVASFFLRAALATVVVSAGITFWLSRSLSKTAPLGPSMAVLKPVSLLAIDMTALGIVAVLSAGTEKNTLLSALMSLPIENIWIGVALSFPAVLVLLTSSVIILPPAVLILGHITGVETLRITLILIPLLTLGFSVGVTLTAMAQRIVCRLRLSLAAIYPIGVASWTLLSMLFLMGWRGGGGFLDQVSGTISNVVSSWPIIVGILNDERNAIPLLILLWVIACAAFLVGLLLYYSSLSSILGLPAHGRVILHWKARGRIPLLRLQVVKLLRRSRVAGSLSATIIVLAVCWLLTATRALAARESLAELCYVIAGSILAHIPLIARGEKSLLVPEVVILRNPRRWAWSVVAGGFVLISIPAIAFIILMSISVPDRKLAVFGVGIILFGCSFGALMGVILRPGADNVGGESAGLIIIGITVYIAVQILGQAFQDPIRIGLAALVLAAVFLPIGAEIENSRGVSSVG